MPVRSGLHFLPSYLWKKAYFPELIVLTFRELVVFLSFSHPWTALNMQCLVCGVAIFC